MEKAYVVLQDGTVFEGVRAGSEKEVIGELVFNTASGSYLEMLTNPACYGQIIISAFPMAGNYGVIPADEKSGKAQAFGYIAREICETPSNFRSEGSLDEFLKQQDIPAVFGVDTREMTRHIRENGTMNAAITAEVTDELMARINAFEIKDAVAKAASNEAYTIPAVGEKKGEIAVVDYGMGSLGKDIAALGYDVFVLPYLATLAEILYAGADTVVLSDGPGDPDGLYVDTIKMLIDHNINVIGIGMGHELLALVMGAVTAKLPYGHRGANQPVRELETGKVYITSQNHGYSVIAATLPDTAKVIFENVNDGTCEGIRYASGAVGVQFDAAEVKDSRDGMSMLEKLICEVKGGHNA